MLCHNPGTPSKNDPCQQRSEHRVADTGPGCGDAVLITELAGVSDEHNGRKIRSAVSEGRQPGSCASSAENKTIHTARLSSCHDTDQNHDSEEDDKKYHFDYHVSCSPSNLAMRGRMFIHPLHLFYAWTL